MLETISERLSTDAFVLQTTMVPGVLVVPLAK